MMNVSRETERRLDLYAERLREWQRVKNLVSATTLDRLWTRHIADSAQLLTIAPTARHWVDLGSGAGFPGLVVAILLVDRGDVVVDLVESNARKCAFLRDVIRLTQAPARVHAARIEVALPTLASASVEIVTSRALAPLQQLVRFSRILLDCGATGLFLTGEHADDSDAQELLPSYAIDSFPSRGNIGSRIMRVRASRPSDRP